FLRQRQEHSRSELAKVHSARAVDQTLFQDLDGAGLSRDRRQSDSLRRLERRRIVRGRVEREPLRLCGLDAGEPQRTIRINRRRGIERCSQRGHEDTDDYHPTGRSSHVRPPQTLWTDVRRDFPVEELNLCAFAPLGLISLPASGWPTSA